MSTRSPPPHLGRGLATSDRCPGKITWRRAGVRAPALLTKLDSQYIGLCFGDHTIHRGGGEIIRARLGTVQAGKEQPGQRQVDGGLSDLMQPGPWVGRVRGPLGAGGCQGHRAQSRALISKEPTHYPFQQTPGMVDTDPALWSSWELGRCILGTHPPHMPWAKTNHMGTVTPREAGKCSSSWTAPSQLQFRATLKGEHQFLENGSPAIPATLCVPICKLGAMTPALPTCQGIGTHTSHLPGVNIRNIQACGTFYEFI